MKINLVQVSKNNVESLRMLVRNCFPLSYTDGLYKRIYYHWNKYTRLALINGIVVGAITTRIDPVSDFMGDLADEKQKKEKKPDVKF